LEAIAAFWTEKKTVEAAEERTTKAAASTAIPKREKKGQPGLAKQPLEATEGSNAAYVTRTSYRQARTLRQPKLQFLCQFIIICLFKKLTKVNKRFKNPFLVPLVAIFLV